MPLTAAQRSKRYRDGKRDGNKPDRHENERDAPSVTVVCQTCGGPVQHPKIVKCYQCVHGKPAAKGVS